MNKFRFWLASLIAPQRPELFLVLKFGNKTYLSVTETQLRAEIAKERAKGAQGVRFHDRALTFLVFEIDPNNSENNK